MQNKEQLQYVLVKKTGFLCLTKAGFWFCSHSQQVESEDNFERIGGSSIGGGTFWGLGALLTKTKVFKVTWISIIVQWTEDCAVQCCALLSLFSVYIKVAKVKALLLCLL